MCMAHLKSLKSCARLSAQAILDDAKQNHSADARRNRRKPARSEYASFLGSQATLLNAILCWCSLWKECIYIFSKQGRKELIEISEGLRRNKKPQAMSHSVPLCPAPCQVSSPYRPASCQTTSSSVLTENGMTLEMLQQALSWTTKLPRISAPGAVVNDVMEGIVDYLLKSPILHLDKVEKSVKHYPSHSARPTERISFALAYPNSQLLA
eukprot:5700700-Amphidinium_carterae.1